MRTSFYISLKTRVRIPRRRTNLNDRANLRDFSRRSDVLCSKWLLYLSQVFISPPKEVFSLFVNQLFNFKCVILWSWVFLTYLWLFWKFFFAGMFKKYVSKLSTALGAVHYLAEKRTNQSHQDSEVLDISSTSILPLPEIILSTAIAELRNTLYFYPLVLIFFYPMIATITCNRAMGWVGERLLYNASVLGSIPF